VIIVFRQIGAATILAGTLLALAACGAAEGSTGQAGTTASVAPSTGGAGAATTASPACSPKPCGVLGDGLIVNVTGLRRSSSGGTGHITVYVCVQAHNGAPQSVSADLIIFKLLNASTNVAENMFGRSGAWAQPGVDIGAGATFPTTANQPDDYISDSGDFIPGPLPGPQLVLEIVLGGPPVMVALPATDFNAGHSDPVSGIITPGCAGSVPLG
jgi:hypothetical protein